MRITLDTNVWLDLLLFENPQTMALARALQALGVTSAAVNERALAELQHMLGAERWPASLLNRAQAAAAALQTQCPFGFHLQLCEQASGMRQPNCTDPDDAHFLELAAASASFTLLSKDRALLKSRRYLSLAKLQAPSGLEGWRGRVASPLQLCSALGLA